MTGRPLHGPASLLDAGLHDRGGGGRSPPPSGEATFGAEVAASATAAPASTIRRGGLLRRPEPAASAAASPVARPASRSPACAAGGAASAGFSSAGLTARRPTLRTSPSWSRVAGPMPLTSPSASLSAPMSAIPPPRSSRALRTASATSGRRPAASTSCSRVASCRSILVTAPLPFVSAPLCDAEDVMRCNMPARGWFRAARPGPSPRADPRLHPALP